MKKKNIINIISIVIIIFYIIFGTNFIDKVKESTASVNNLSNENKKIEVKDELKVYFLDVGQADSILISSNDHNMLIDAGNNEDGEKIVSYLKKMNINKFDYVIATHVHEDHIGGMDDIINNFSIESFYMPDAVTTTKTFEDVLDSLLQKNMSIKIPKIDEEFNLGESTIKVIYSGDKTNDLNDSSIVLRLTHGNVSFLFMGDATSNIEKQLISKNINSNVLKVGHHGSQYSTTEAFLNAVKPKYAIISVGKNNSYGHPNKETINKLNKRNIKIYRTDINGTIIFTSNGSDISVKTMITNIDG